MDDDKLKSLFDNFSPQLSSPTQFMETLQRNMDAVEYVKRENESLRRRNRIAVAIAAVCGFATGVILTLLFPILSNWISSISITLPHFNTVSLNFDHNIIAWLLIGAISVVISLNTYEIAMARLKPRLQPS